MGALSLCAIILLSLNVCAASRLTPEELNKAKVILKELLELEKAAHDNDNVKTFMQKRTRDDCSGTTGSFSGIEYASLGYNILRGYPLTAGRDPGFTSPIFNPNYNPPMYSDNCEFQLPHGFHFQPITACATSMTSEEISNKYSFDESLSTTTNTEGGAWGVSFSASSEYKNSVSTMDETHSEMVLSEAECQTYYAQVDRNSPPTFADGFLADVRQLQTHTDDAAYLKFIDTLGTHYVKDMTFGARFAYRYDMTSEQHDTLTESSFSIETQASYSGIYTASGGVGMSQDQREAAENFQKNTKSSSYSVGAQPTSDGNALAWASAVNLDNPMPIIFTLDSIENLFTDEFFKNTDIDYQTIRENLIRVQPMYCQMLLDRGEVTSCEPEEPKVCTFSPYQRIRCIGDYGGIQKNECEDLDCCYDDTVDGVHYCFEPKGVCATPPYKRVACDGAYGGITSFACHALGCCYDDNVEGVPFCFPKTVEPVDPTPDLDCAGSSHQRIRCIGDYGGITMTTCESMDCCFDDSTPDVTFCYTPKGVCDGPPTERVACPGAYGGIDMFECHKFGCCYDTRVSGVPWCYIP